MKEWFIENQGYVYTFLFSLIPTSIAGAFSWYKYSQLERRTAKDYRYEKESEYSRLAKSLKKHVANCYSTPYYGNNFREGEIGPLWDNAFDGEFHSNLQQLEKLLSIYMPNNDKRHEEIKVLKSLLSQRKEIISDKNQEEFNKIYGLIIAL